MKLKIRAYDSDLDKVITEENSGLLSAEILKRYDNHTLALFRDDGTPILYPSGEQVYEGDIIAWKGGLIKNQQLIKEIKLSFIDGINVFLAGFNGGYWEKIGNIYQNKNLINL